MIYAYDLPAAAFPIVLQIFELDDPATPVWEAIVTAAGSSVKVPGFGRPMRTRIEYGDGSFTVDSPGEVRT